MTLAKVGTAHRQQLSIGRMPGNFKAASFPSVKIRQGGGWLIGVVMLLLVGCTATPPARLPPIPPAPVLPVGLGSDAQATPEAAITALILAERQAAIAHNLPLLGALWAEDAQIVDGRNSATPADDYRWQGRAAILDRYQVAVFPFTVPPLAALDASAVITITGEHATVEHLQDHWQLAKVDGRWWLTELRYSEVP